MTKVQVECKVSFVLDIKEGCSDDEIRELIDKNIENTFRSNDIHPKGYTYRLIGNGRVPQDQISEGLIVEIRRKNQKRKYLGVVIKVQPYMKKEQVLVKTKERNIYQCANYDDIYYSNVKPEELIMPPKEDGILTPLADYKAKIGYVLDKNDTYKIVMVEDLNVNDKIVKLYIVHNGELSKPTYYEVPANQLQNFMVFEKPIKSK